MTETRLLRGADLLVLFLYTLPLAAVSYLVLKLSRWIIRTWHSYGILFENPGESSNVIQHSTNDSETGDGLESCPICMGTIVYKIQTNCGHRFCEPCFFLHWRGTLPSGTVYCPLCRSRVSQLTPMFTAGEALRGLMHQSSVHAFNRSFSRSGWRPRDLLCSLRDTILLTFRGGLVPSFDSSHVVWTSALVSLYLLSPLDLLPEALMGPLGFVDDLVVILIYVYYVMRIFWY